MKNIKNPEITFCRRLEILTYLNLRREGREVREIANHLIQQRLLGSDLSDPLRPVQNDLNFLAGMDQFDLVQSRGLGNGRVWQIEGYYPKNINVEKMPSDLALAMSLTGKHLSEVLPPSSYENLEQYFEVAKKQIVKELKGVKRRNIQRLIDRVEIGQRGFSLTRTANVDKSILDVIYRAIEAGRWIEIDYTNAVGLASKKEIDPAGIVFLAPKIYLVSRTSQSQYFHFLVHRISSAKMLSRRSLVSDDFSLKDYIIDGNLEIRLCAEKSTDNIVIEISDQNGTLAKELVDTPVHPGQVLKENINRKGTYTLTIPCDWTIQIRNWVLTLGNCATVLSPAHVREDMVARLRSSLEKYNAINMTR